MIRWNLQTFLQFYQLIFSSDFLAEDSAQSVALSNQKRKFDEIQSFRSMKTKSKWSAGEGLKDL